jgi:voltage-dependent calcium channel
MASEDRSPPRFPTPQSIPLQDLSRPPDDDDDDNSQVSRSGGRSTVRSPRMGVFGRTHGSRYERLDEGSPSPPFRSEADRPRPTTSRLQVSPYVSNEGAHSPVDDLPSFAAATSSLGLSFGPSEPSWLPSRSATKEPTRPTINVTSANDSYTQAERQPSFDAEDRLPPGDADTAPLTGGERLHPTTRVRVDRASGQGHDRQGKRQSVHWTDGESAGPSPRRSHGSRLGDDLHNLEEGQGFGRMGSTTSGISRVTSITNSGRSRSQSPSASISPIARANSMLRMMSQRVVNLSNDTEMVEQSIRRKSSVKSSRLEGPPSFPAMLSDAHDDIAETGVHQPKPVDKLPSTVELQGGLGPVIHPNPLRGRSLGLFGAENKIRKGLCEMLVHPVTEPLILILIVIQTILLALDSAQSVYNDPRSKKWGTSKTDYALFVLFVIYTLEIVARTIVSGFILNPTEYSTLDRSLGLRKAIVNQGRSLFAPQRQRSTKKATVVPAQPSIIRSFTGLQPNIDIPGHGRQHQRVRLAKRAFLRHSFNRLDFVAVISYWISFALALSRVESNQHIYVFRMLSALRILRLLGLTSGTSVILRSLKKAAPLLANVAFLISFFWLLFAIVGVQSFKSSFRRTCVWLGQDGQSNYTHNIAPGKIQFCGGYLDAETGAPMPWRTAEGLNGTAKHKGYLCPQGSVCVEGFNPYSGTVSFDNAANSLQLVFVIISSNTFSDLLYYLTETDYLAAAIFFAAAIVIMTLWLMNLLVAVITSSFQIIREESKRSAFATEQIEETLIDEDLAARKTPLRRLYDKTYWLWIAVIVLSLVVQSLRSSRMGDDRQKLVNDTETVVTLALLLEIILRFASDWRNFFYSRRNWADLVLAIVTSVTQIPPIRKSGQAYAWLSAFQVARIYRVVLAFSVTRDLIMVVFGNIGGVLNLIVFVFLITFLTAILASQLFRGEFPGKDTTGATIRITFSDIYNSFIGMYQVLTSENWTKLMFNATEFDVKFGTAWLAAIFFVMWFILANFIILNMFIAVIQESFEVSEDEKRLQQVRAFLQQKELGGSSHGNLPLSSILKLGRDSLRRRDPLDYGPATMEMLLKEAVVKEFLEEQEQTPIRRPTDIALPAVPVATVNTGVLSALWGKITGLNSRRETNPFYSKMKFSRAYEDLDPQAMAKEVLSAAEQRRRAQRQYLARHPRYNVSLFIFGPNNAVRRFCQRIVGPGRGDQRIEGVDPYKPVWYSFSAVIYLTIVGMVLIACITTPIYQREYFERSELNVRTWFIWTDMGFAIFFTLEAAIKVVADGFFFTPNAYFRGSWGFIDGIVLVTLWISVITSIYRDDGISRAVGAFKALRALRLLNVSDSARDTFHSVIILGGWKIISAAFVSISLLIPFAILGLNLFNGQMESCNDGDFGHSELSNCVGEYQSEPFNWPVLAPRQVSNPYYNFDNFGNSLFILFQIVSQEGWTDVMWSAMSMTGKGIQPKDFAAQGNAVFFIIFNLLGAVFVLTLFVSVFMRNYTEQTGVAFLTADQRSWLELRKLLRQISPSKRSLGKASSRYRKWCYRMAVQKHGAWQRFITGVLLLHLVLLVLEFYPSVDWWDKLRDGLFLAFTIIYIINIVVRLFGLSWQRFRRSSWDLYSIVTVSGVFLTTIMRISSYSNRTFDQLHKLFLVSIAFLLIPRNNSLDQLFKTAAASFTKIGNLLATWFVLFLVYAIAFTQAFGLTRFGGNESGNLNFRDVPRALILLFRMSCGEGWNEIMEDFAVLEPPYCVLDKSFFRSDCGSAVWARGLFISWNIISMYIFVSLFVSLIFESFSYVYQRSSGLSVISREEIRRFKQAWADFDPDGTGYISKDIFPRLLRVCCWDCVPNPG